VERKSASVVSPKSSLTKRKEIVNTIPPQGQPRPGGEEKKYQISLKEKKYSGRTIRTQGREPVPVARSLAPNSKGTPQKRRGLGWDNLCQLAGGGVGSDFLAPKAVE